MKIDEPEFRQMVFDLVNDALDLEQYPVPESEIVKNEFEDGSYCSLAYREVLDAYSRLCQRLQGDDLNDPDVEIIVNNLLSIGRHLSLKMFEYGVLFARCTSTEKRQTL